MTQVQPHVQLDNVSVELNGNPILHGVSTSLTADRIAVVGANGSGKSTFVRLLNGLVQPTDGTVRVLGTDSKRDARGLRKRVGFVFSNPDAQIIMPTVREDLEFSLRGRGIDKRETAERIAETLETFGLAPLAAQAAHSLSGGQKQLLALAAVLVTRPDLVIADEPTALLDAANAKLIENTLLTAECKVIIVTHDLRLAAKCDHAIRFANGQIALEGEPSAVIGDYERALL